MGQRVSSSIHPRFTCSNYGDYEKLKSEPDDSYHLQKHPQDYEKLLSQETDSSDIQKHSQDSEKLKSKEKDIFCIQINPQELHFPFELRKQLSCTLRFSNKSDNYVAFKVKTTNPKKYCVRPNNGVVLPRSICDITVTMQAQKKAPPNIKHCIDKFLIQSIVAWPGATTKDISEMFEKKSGNEVKECKFRVFYDTPQPPDLQIHPQELQFSFELNKQISCCLQLSNKSDNYVAFKVKTTNPWNYDVRPIYGVVLPRSICDITVTMQAQKEAPPGMQCKDEFLIQSVAAPAGATAKDITSKMNVLRREANYDDCHIM